jgi:hypothetical protein
MTKKLPIYKLVVTDNEESGVNFNSFVEQPATEEDFFLFSKDEEPKEIKFKADPKRRLVTGVMMVADKPIYRNSNGEEFMVVFDKETVEKISQKFMRDGFSKNVNTDHNKEVDGVYLTQTFVTDKEMGIEAPKGFPKLNEGTWIATYKVENDEVWDDVLKGKFKGFSVEGVFNKELVKMSKTNKMQENKKELFEGLKNLVSKYLPKDEPETLQVKMTEAVLQDGETMVSYDAEVIATGVVVNLVVDGGQLQAMPQGSYVLQDGTSFDIVDEDGMADNVVLAEAPTEETEQGEQPAATGADMATKEPTQVAKKVIESTVKESHFNEQEMKEIEKLKEDFKALSEKFEALTLEKAEFATAKEESDNKVNELFELVKKIGEQPAAEPTEKKPKKFNMAEQKAAFKADLHKNR